MTRNGDRFELVAVRQSALIGYMEHQRYESLRSVTCLVGLSSGRAGSDPERFFLIYRRCVNFVKVSSGDDQARPDLRD
jgi:hypothetical protein